MTAAIQTVWAELLLASLADAGVADVVVSPGSRSTPLVAALAREALLRAHPVIDERAAGFFALGLARAAATPVALICTSGTAAAHYLPAVIEAALAGIPLVIVSADRPPELHGAGASQTIDQLRLFGGFVRRFDDLGPPEGSPLALRALRRKVAQAVAAARGPTPGPVHLNVPLRKPLEPAAPGTEPERAAAAEAARLVKTALPVAPATVRVPDSLIDRVASAIASAPRGLIVATAGPATRAAARASAFTLASRAGYPLLAEAGSGLRFATRPDDVVAIDRFGLVVSAPLARDLGPELIVQLGGEPVAMGWTGFAAGRARRFVLAEHGWPDGDSTAEAVLLGDVADTLGRIVAALPSPRLRGAWTRAWADADRAARAAMDRALVSPGAEGAAVAAAIGAVPDGGQLVLGNSLPVRVADEVADGGRDLTVLTQRGAAGIDGLIAGAAGAAAAGRPTVLVLGDVSFAHDLGALACVGGRPLAIVVIDNGGGRIFDDLPVAASTLPDGAFERLWRTPPAVDAVAAARAFGLVGARVRSPDELPAAIRAALAGGGGVVHVPVAPTSARTARAAALAELAALPANDSTAARSS